MKSILKKFISVFLLMLVFIGLPHGLINDVINFDLVRIIINLLMAAVFIYISYLLWLSSKEDR